MYSGKRRKTQKKCLGLLKCGCFFLFCVFVSFNVTRLSWTCHLSPLCWLFEMTFIIFHVEHKNMFYADYTFQSVSTSTLPEHTIQQTIKQKILTVLASAADLTLLFTPCWTSISHIFLFHDSQDKYNVFVGMC